jgi:hypothetical protein
MGGIGSGSHLRWRHGLPKTLVEHCLTLDANRWMRKGILTAAVRRSGSCTATLRGSAIYPLTTR